MKKTKILQFPIANSKGGMTHYVLQNWKWMDKEKFQCDFVTMSKHLDFEDEVLATGSRIFHISCYAEENKEQFVKEFDEILDEGYDVVHLHTKQWKSFLMEEICKKHYVPKVIVHAHNTGIDTLDPIKRKEEELLHEQVKKKFDESMATDFWACSRMAADFLFGEQIPRDRIKIMPNAIELDTFAYNQSVRNEYRREYGLEDSFVIGHVGRFVYQKNHEFLINVFSEVAKEVENVRLILIGDGELFGKVQNLAKNLGLENKILFLGKRDDVENWYQVMDVFCLPSRFEGLGMALVEAQASGLPCIGSSNVPKDVEISNNIVRIELNISEWAKQVLACLSWERENGRMLLAKAGYDVCEQIKIIEKYYWGGVIHYYKKGIINCLQMEMCA